MTTRISPVIILTLFAITLVVVGAAPIAPSADCPVVSINPYPVTKYHIATTSSPGEATTKDNTDGPDPTDFPPRTQLTLVKSGEKSSDTGENCLVVYNIVHVKSAPYKTIQPEILQLKKLLADRPAHLPKAAYGKGTLSGEESLPDYPISDSTQLFQTQNRYLDLAWGSGIGYVTVFAQDTGPITNDGLVYFFQGLSRDGKYYVSATLDISQAQLLSKYDDVPMKSRDEKGIEAFNANVLALLAAQNDSGFTPGLDKIQKWLGSLKIQ